MAAKKKIVKHVFNASTLSFIEDLELADGWSNVEKPAVDELLTEMTEEYDTEEMDSIMVPWWGLQDFIASISSDLVGEASDHILGAHTEEGVLDRVSGPSIRKNPDDDESMVLIVGGNTYSVSFAKGKYTCGELTGKATVSEKKVDGKVQQTKDGYPIYEASVGFIKNGGDFYQVDLSLDLKACPEFVELQVLVDTDQDLIEYLKLPTSGGGYVDMGCLPEGEYECLGIKFDGFHKDGGSARFKLNLKGIENPVSARGSSLIDKLSGPNVSETSGNWVRMNSSIKKRGSITLLISFHEVEVGKGEKVPFIKWATTEELFKTEKVRHFISAGIFTRRKPHPEKAVNLEFANKVIENAYNLYLAGKESGPEPEALPTASTAPAIEPAADEGEQDDIPF